MRAAPIIRILCGLSVGIIAGCGPFDKGEETGAAHRSSMTVLQLGDSHTAADLFSGHLRTLFQQRFGRGARGMLPPGAIYRGYHPHEVALHQEGEWHLFNAWQNPGDGPYGLSGYRLTGDTPDARLIYEVPAGDSFNRIRLGVLGGPHSGSLVLKAGANAPIVIKTRRAEPGYAQKVISLRHAATRVTLHPSGNGVVSLLSIGLEHPGRAGVTYVSHGVPSATVQILARMDESILKQEFEALDPSLIILAYGTNEGFDDSLDPASYRHLFETQVRRIKRLTPQARIEVVGPPDADRLVRGAGKRRAAGERSCLPHPEPAGGDGRGYWYVPETLGSVRRVQHLVARARGYGFWDWSTVMGGKCGMHEWANAVPPKAFADHVHMTDAGAAESARQLFGTLMRTYGNGWGPLSGEKKEAP